jgi:hypothetical protein
MVRLRKNQLLDKDVRDVSRIVGSGVTETVAGTSP